VVQRIFHGVPEHTPPSTPEQAHLVPPPGAGATDAIP